MSKIDWLAVALYFLVVFAVALRSAIGRSKVREDSSQYFLAGRHVGWFVIGASLFASNIGSEHLVGLAGAGASTGLAVSQFEIMAAFCLLMLGWVFVPFYLRSGVFTMPEFLERRYSKAARRYLALVTILSYVLTKISVTIAAGGIVFEQLLGIDFWAGALVVVVATGIYTVLGGLRAVLLTDLLQMFVLIGGALLVTMAGVSRIGGIHELRAAVEPEMFSLWKSARDPNFPWTGIVFGIPIVGVWYWCTDQFIVQRVLAARNETQAKLGTIFAAYLKLLPMFLFVLPGVVAFALVQRGDLEISVADQALPALVAELLPSGLRGIVVAGLLAALMSSLSSVFNSCSTLITWDIYRELRPQATERQLVWVGQLSTAALVVLGLLWIPLIKLISTQLYQYLQSVQAYISPPITAVFLLGLCWRRVNGRGAMAALLIGFVLGMGRLALELFSSHLSPSGTLYWLATINFLHFAILLFAICVTVLVLVSFTAPPPTERQTNGLTFGGTKVYGRVRTGPLALTVLLLVLIGVIYVSFTG